MSADEQKIAYDTTDTTESFSHALYELILWIPPFLCIFDESL